MRQGRSPSNGNEHLHGANGGTAAQRNVDGGSSVGSRFSLDPDNGGESEKTPKKRKRSPKSSKMNPNIVMKAGDYPVTFKTQIIEEMRKGGKGESENSTRRENFTRIFIDGKPAPFLLTKLDASNLASKGLINVPDNDIDEASDGGSVNPVNENVDNGMNTIFGVLKENKIKITLQCPACNLDENNNRVKCGHHFTIKEEMWAAMFLKADSMEPCWPTLPDKDGIWVHPMMARQHLAKSNMIKDAPSHFGKMLTKHIAIKKGLHVDECMGWTFLKKKIETAHEDYRRNVEQYRMMQFDHILEMPMPLLGLGTITRSMRGDLGAIDMNNLNTVQKEWASFIEKTKCDISKGILTVTAEKRFELIAQKFHFTVQKNTLCNLCQEETILYPHEEGKPVPANARMICKVCKIAAGIACRGCLKQNHERNRWSSNLRDGINVQDTSQCPMCRTPDQFKEGVLPPLLGNDDLKLYVEELEDTHKEVHKELSATIWAKRVCGTVQKKYLAETQKNAPDEEVLMRHTAKYIQNYRRVTNSLSSRSIKLRTRHHIDNFPGRLAYIIDNFNGETSDDDKKLLKSAANKQSQLAGIMTQYIAEFERGSDVWTKGFDALTREDAVPQNGPRETHESRNTDGMEVIEIVD